MDMNLGRSLQEWAAQLRAGQITSTAIVEATLTHIERCEPSVKAFVAVHREEALAQAKACDARLAKGERPVSPLFGLPVALKDNLCVTGWEVTCASKILKGYVAPYDATVVSRLKEAGAVLVGLCNMDEFAMGSSTENSSYGPSKNPWDLQRVPGGSSGGSAAAAAYGGCVAALGSDTGGSIRQPGAFCGVVGFKPTYGRISRYGLIAFASSLDQIGPLTRTVWDAAAVYEALAGHDPMDSTSLPQPVEPVCPSLTVSQASQPLAGLRVGIPDEYFVEGLDAEVRQLVEQGIGQLTKLGAACGRVSLPHSQYGLSTYYLIAPAEASSNLARYDGVHYGLRSAYDGSLADMSARTRGEGFGPEVKRRILIGAYVLSAGYYEAYYARALKIRTLIKGDFDAAFKKFDVLVTPVTPTPPFAFGERAANPLQMYLSDVMTIPTSLAGLPGISVPAGFTAAGLPVGMQFIGPALGEKALFRAAYAYEQAAQWSAVKQPAWLSGGPR